MKNTVTSLRLPNSLKRFLAWIWKYFVSVCSEWEGLEGGGAQRGHGAQKGEGAPLGVKGGVGVAKGHDISVYYCSPLLNARYDKEEISTAKT